MKCKKITCITLILQYIDVQGGSMCSIYRLMQLIFSTSLKGIIRKNANYLQTTDTLKRHQRYSIRYHCGWPSLGIWGSATHNGLPALPEPYLHACGLHRVCTRLKKNQNSRAVLWCSWWFYVFNFIDWCNLFFFMLLNLNSSLIFPVPKRPWQ